MGMEFFAKAAKAVGKQLLGEVDGVGSYATGAFNIGKKIYKAGKGPMSKLHGMAMEEDAEATFLKTKMKKGYSRGLLAAGVIGGGAMAIGSGSGRGKMGEIRGGDLANTTGLAISHDLDKTLGDAKSSEEFQNKGTNINNHGAGGDIVMALHQLRKG